MIPSIVGMVLCFVVITTAGCIYVGAKLQAKQIEAASKPSNPSKRQTMLIRTAALEHECELLPHVSDEVMAVCAHNDCRIARLPKPPSGSGGGSRNVFIPLEKETWGEHKRLLEKEKQLQKHINELQTENKLFAQALAAFKNYNGSGPTEEFLELTPQDAQRRGYSKAELEVVTHLLRLGLTPNEVRTRLGYPLGRGLPTELPLKKASGVDPEPEVFYH